MRVKSGAVRRRKRKRILKAAKGYVGGRRRLYRTAKEAVMRASQYAYRDRRQRKRDFRRLWITRISAAAKMRGLSYSQFMGALAKANVEIDRKMLADLAVTDEAAFDRLVEVAKEQLAAA